MNTSSIPRTSSGRFAPRSENPRAPYPGELAADGWAYDEWEKKPVYKRYAPPVKHGVKSLDERLVLTDRDLQMIRFAGRYRYVTHALLVEFTAGSSEALKTRLRRLRQNNLMRSQILHSRQLGKVEVWRPTKLGHRIADTDLKVIPDDKVSPATLNHTLGVAKVGCDWERTGHLTVTELEWRRDHPERLDKHVPDLLVERVYNEGEAEEVRQTLAVELELHKKSPLEIYKVMLWYAKNDFIMHYIATKPSVIKVVTEEATRHKIADRLEILRALPLIPPRL